MPNRKYTREDRIKAMKLYQGGMSSKDVSELTGISESMVQRWARQMGIIRPRNYSSLSEDDKKEIRHLYVFCRQSRRQIAKQTGISQWVIYNYLKKNDLVRSRSKAVSIVMKGRKRGPYNKVEG